MKTLKYNSRLFAVALICTIATVFSACEKSLSYKDAILITGTQENKMVKFIVEGVPSSYAVTATATEKVPNDVTVSFEVDTNLVAEYSKEMAAKYYAPPTGSYEMVGGDVTIKAGSNISDAVTVYMRSIANFVEGRTYVLPVKIKSVTGSLEVLDASRVIYLKIARVLDFKSIDISAPAFYYTYPFTTPVTNISKYTFEIKCFIDAFHGTADISRLCNWGPIDESLPNLLRFGEAGSKINQLQWVSAEGSMFSKTEFTTKTWYTISCVYDGVTYKMYVNGKLDGSFSGGGKVYQFAMLELGMSYAGYQTSQRFLGRVAEIRFWDRALSVTEINEGICNVDAAANGLVSYWKMNEGSGNIFYDRTGKGRNMTWPKTTLWNASTENKCVQ
ncbi:DUF1735 and LamG domain-containing protein [Pedobacter sp. MC2016-14]|uniref:DUF1735 and LamG domain-containing protein n=1 Tax=Pedobacter sp. MC2016-14 TaxID=2897327 RepID=UPI001E369BA0|nr:DUF1735 and LamG domain-containing protein [Pedobacter sp. MC2016-14]MCD0488700.1 DUF1735 and LamG domain-containing protein [Pedobacter sp. MC2016-14]